MAHDLSRNHKRQRGLATIEAALILPMLLLLTFGILEYGWIFIKSGQINNAARHGVRAAVLPDATVGDVSAAIDDFMSRAGLAESGYSAVLSADPAAVEPGTPISVTITVDYEGIALTQFPLLPTPGQLGGEVAMAKEGP